MIRRILTVRMLVSLSMGFSCGLPLSLTTDVLKAWMKQDGMDLMVIGMISFVQIPYAVKFLWAPFLDHYALPFLGRRRGWLLIVQIALCLSIVGLGWCEPARFPVMMSVAAFLVAFLSASQDIVVDAYRREDLSDEELGAGSSLYVNGYRIGMIAASGGGLILADYLSFQKVYSIMALGMIPGMVTTLLAREPMVEAKKSQTVRAAVIEPLSEYFHRPNAVWMLAFILCYKIGDTMAAAMTMPFYLEIGFTKTQIGAVVKVFGFWAVGAGTLIGGILMLRTGIERSLWIFGIFQALSTAGFALLSRIGNHTAALSAVIGFENLTSGMGTSAYMAFMASITNKRFTATQYALLSSLMGVPRVMASAPTGWIATYLGWEGFFIFCTAMAIPGLLLLKTFNTTEQHH